MNSSNSSKKRGGPDSDTTITKFPCKLYPKNVSDNDNATLCDLCQNVTILILLRKISLI